MIIISKRRKGVVADLSSTESQVSCDLGVEEL